MLYSGRGAFSRPSLVYLLGFNPGSESKPGPNKPKLRTVRENIEYVGQKPGRFSLYYEPWEEGRTEAMQVRMRHLFKRTDSIRVSLRRATAYSCGPGEESASCLSSGRERTRIREVLVNNGICAQNLGKECVSRPGFRATPAASAY